MQCTGGCIPPPSIQLGMFLAVPIKELPLPRQVLQLNQTREETTVEPSLL